MAELTAEQQYFRAVHEAILGDGVFPEGHEWAGFTGPESLAYSRRNLTAAEARAERAQTQAPAFVPDTGKLTPPAKDGKGKDV